MVIKKYNSPLPQGKELEVFNLSPTAAGSEEAILTLDADTVLASVQVTAVTGTVDIEVFTETPEEQQVKVIDFPTISAPTTDLLLRKAAAVMARIRVKVSFTGACTFVVRVRGIGTGEASVRLLGSSDAIASQKDITTGTAQLLITAAIVDRAGMVVKNFNTSGTVYIGFSTTEATTANGYPIGPQESLGLDVASGVEVYATADVGTIDMRIMEAGG